MGLSIDTGDCSHPHTHKVFLLSNYILLGAASSCIFLTLSLRLFPSLIGFLFILLQVITIAGAVSGCAASSRAAASAGKFYGAHMVATVLTAIFQGSVSVLIFTRPSDFLSHLKSYVREDDGVVILKLAGGLCILMFCLEWVVLTLAFFLNYYAYVERKGINGNNSYGMRGKTGNLKEFFSIGKKLGQGQFGTTFMCVEKSSGKQYACKSIAKRKLLTDEDVEDVRREIQIMHHLAGHPNVISIKGAYEDAVAVHLVMELCVGGELFDRIIQRGHYTERKAAELTRTIVGVVEACHSLGVMHRDLKPENFLFVDQKEESLLKTIDFGLSIFFKPGEKFNDVVGSPYYVAPEVLRKRYGPEADVWSAGVIVYILLSGVPPFWAETEQGIFEQVLRGDLDFASDPWPSISEDAKDLVRKMLLRDPKRRLTAHEVLCHPWVQIGGVAPDKPLDSAILSRLKQFSAMNRLKKMALRVIAESLSEDEIAGLKEMFKMIDTDDSGHITFEELKAGLKRFGANLKESEIYDLMQAADVDNSGTIDYGEFIAATLHLNKIERGDHLFVAFSYFDKDGSGYITPDELQQACQEFGLDDSRLEEMIREVDQDNDGRIDYNEFVTMMQKGNPIAGGVKRGLENSFSVNFREALKLT